MAANLLENTDQFIHLLNLAKKWNEAKFSSEFLISGEERKIAEKWLLENVNNLDQNNRETDLICEYLCQSKEYANNYLTDVFICHDNFSEAEYIHLELNKKIITTFIHSKDIKEGDNILIKYKSGILHTSNILLIVDKKSLNNENFRECLRYAKSLNKRIIVALTQPDIVLDNEFSDIQIITCDFSTDPLKADFIDKFYHIIIKDKDYYDLHREFLVKGTQWFENGKKQEYLLYGFDCQYAKAWLNKYKSRKENSPLPIHLEFIAASNVSRSTVFISYGRKQSKVFAGNLYKRLINDGFDVWFDLNDIPLGVDFQEQIDSGIQNADNFLFLISPHSVRSPYCLKEIVLALTLNKRIIPILHIEPVDDWDKLHPAIGKINWVYMRQKYDETKPLTDWENIDDINKAYSGMLELMQSHSEYVRKHTIYLNKAKEWEKNQKSESLLLRGNDLTNALNWLLTQFKDVQAPCNPTDLHSDFITESKKYANINLTDIFFSYAREDADIKNKIRSSLNRKGYSTWQDTSDLKTGTKFLEAIYNAIEQSSHFLFLISPDSVTSEYCIKELDYAISLNKRIIPLMVKNTDPSQIPAYLREIQYVNISDNTEEPTVNTGNLSMKEQVELDVKSRKEKSPFEKDMDDLFAELTKDTEYYEKFRNLQAEAIRWKKQNNNNGYLIRGFELQNAEAWLEIGLKRDTNTPTEIHKQYITESRAKISEISPEIFIGYSMDNQDFINRLKENLHIQGKIIWCDQEFIEKDANTYAEVFKGIEESDNCIFVISKESLKNDFFLKQCSYTRENNKRIIPLLLDNIEQKDLPDSIADIPVINFIPEEKEFSSSFSDLLRRLDFDREYIKNHNKWAQKAKEWDNKSRPKDLLLRGFEYDTALNWKLESEKENKKPRITPVQNEFIKISQEAIIAEIKYKKRVDIMIKSLLVGVSILFLFSIFLGYKAWKQKLLAEEKQREAHASNLIFSAMELEKKDPTKSLNLALEAQKINESANIDITIRELYSNNFFSKILATFGTRAKSVAVSPNGKYIASGDETGTIHILSPDGTEIKALKQHTKSVLSIAFSNDGNYLISGAEDNLVIIWNLQNFSHKAYNVHNKKVYALTFSPNGKYFVSGSEDKTAVLYDLETNQKIILKNQKDLVNAVAFSPDNKTFATASFDKTIVLYDLTGKALKTFRGHENEITSVTFSPDGKSILSGSADYYAIIWNLNGKIKKILKGHFNWINAVAYDNTGKYILSASDDKTVIIWDTLGNNLVTLKGNISWVKDACFSPDGKYVYTASDDKTVRRWDISDFEQEVFSGHNNIIRKVAFTNDGKYLATASEDSTAKIWDVSTNKCIATLRGHKAFVSSVQFSNDGHFLLTGSYDKTAIIWDWKNKNKPIVLSGKHTDQVYNAVFSKDNKFILTASRDTSVVLWDITGKPLRVFTRFNDVVRDIDFAPDGKHFVTGSDDLTVRITSLDTLEKQKILIGHEKSVYAVKYSPDGKYIISGSRDYSMKLWSVQDCKEIKSFRGHTDAIRAVGFSPDGKYIISGSQDRTARIWTLEGKELQILRGTGQYIWTAIFSPDAKYVVLGSGDMTARKYKIKQDINEYLSKNDIQPLSTAEKLEYKIIDFDYIKKSKNRDMIIEAMGFYENKVKTSKDEEETMDCALKTIDLHETLDLEKITSKELIVMNEMVLYLIKTENHNATEENTKAFYESIEQVFEESKFIDENEDLFTMAKYFAQKSTLEEDITEACNFTEKSLDLFDELLSRPNLDKRLLQEIAIYNGEYYTYFLLTESKFVMALRAAQLAEKADAGELRIYPYLSLAYLFANQIEKSKEIINKYKNEQINNIALKNEFLNALSKIEIEGITNEKLNDYKKLLE